MTALKWLLIVVLTGYACGLVVLFFAQRSFLFPIPTAERTTPQAAGFPEAQEHVLTTADGEKVIVWHVPARPGHPVILYFHGNTRSIKGWARYAKDFYRYNYDVVLVDYRGFGKSTGKRSEKEMLDDTQFVYNALAKQYHEHHIIVYGRSLGSGFAAKVASENKPRYLILDSPYYNFQRVVERFLPILPVRYVLRYHLRTDKWICHVNCHTYIIHGTKDRLIPIRHSEALQKLNPGKITLIRIHGGGHNNLPKFDEYHNFIRDILKY